MKKEYKKAIIIGASAGLLFFMVKMCETEKISQYNYGGKDDIEILSDLQKESDSLLTEVLQDIDSKQRKYEYELDSLNNIILNDNLTVDEVNKLKKKIIYTEDLLEDAKKDKGVKKIFIKEKLEKNEVEIQPVISQIINVKLEDSVELNIIQKDSIVYNIVEKDSVVNKIVYKIDTVYYNSDEIKKLKLKNN